MTIKGSYKEHYQQEYACRYIERTLGSPYTTYKNQTLSMVAREIGASRVLDLGCNVSPIIKREGSLRFQMEQQGIKYVSMDLSFSYFNRGLASDLNVTQDETYEKVDGVVGDMLKVPMKDSSFKLITCADVLEHVPDPDKAFEEIARVLSESGRALIVLPSMYKLDVADFSHIETKRKSSHESKLTASGWKTKWDQAGLEVDYEKSRPLGVASGLSYLAWLSDNFVPERKQLDGEETYSEQAELHKKAKQILSNYDREIDNMILSGYENASAISQAMKDGDIQQVFKILETIINTIPMSDGEKKTCNDFFQSAANIRFNEERIKKLRNIYQSQDNPLYLMGNSMLIVLKKK